MGIKLSDETKKKTSVVVSALGAIGVALQNYIAVSLFLREIINGFTSISKMLSGFIHVASIGLGGVCSGMVNYFINLDLLEGFLDRISRESVVTNWSTGKKLTYYGGIFVFAVTGVLFGLTAFTIGMATPLAALGVASGILVAVIMTIQEIETWLQGFDDPDMKWKATLTFGKFCGHLLAAGNVLALSLLFTLGLTEVLIALSVSALPAFVIGLSVAFTFGAFTEFYFYNFFLAKFCQQFKANWEAMKATQYAGFGYFCITTNAFVNAALTFSGVGLLTGAIALTGMVLPPVGLILTLSVVSAIFAGGASAVLGMDFWIRKQGSCAITLAALPDETEISKISMGGFTKGYVLVEKTVYYCDKKANTLDKLELGTPALEKLESMGLFSGVNVPHALSNTDLETFESLKNKKVQIETQPVPANSPLQNPIHYQRGNEFFLSAEQDVVVRGQSFASNVAPL